MKIYLASRYTRRSELVNYMKELEAIGHIVTSTWLKGEEKPQEALAYSNEPGGFEATQKIAIDDWADIRDSYLIINFTEDPKIGTPRGGRHVEFGIGISEFKQLWIVGPRENVFHYLPGIRQFHNFNEALSALK